MIQKIDIINTCFNIITTIYQYISNMVTILDIPDELIVEIFSHTNVKSLTTIIPQVCTDFNRIATDDIMWKYLCKIYCNITEKPDSDTWNKVLFNNYCKHFLSLDWQMLKDKWTPEHRQSVTDSDCMSIGCTVAKNELWVCLNSECDFIGCGRTQAAHSLEHAKNSDNSHYFTLKWSTKDVWCYHCSKYINKHKHKNEEPEYNHFIKIVYGESLYDVNGAGDTNDH